MPKAKSPLRPEKARLGRPAYVTNEMRENCSRAILMWRDELGRNAGREGPATQQEFAAFLGVRVYDVSDWEQAKRLPGRDTNFRITDLLRVDAKAVLSPTPPHLPADVRLPAFTLRVVDDLADPVLRAKLELLVTEYNQKNFEKVGPKARPKAPPKKR